MMWSESARPSSISGMVGNEKPRAELLAWLATWKKGSRPVLLVGPPGTGKTTLATLAAEQYGYDIIGINASDARSKSRINKILSPVLGNAGLAGSTLIFVDEVDGIHGRADFGGSAALAQILKEPTVPIILAANSDASDKMRAIAKASSVIRLGRVPPRLLGAYLRDIVARNGAKIGPGSIINILSESRGDIRAMLNLAQSLAHGFSPDVAREEGTRTPEEAMAAFFAAGSREEARAALDSMRADPREKISAVYASVMNARALGVSRAATMMRAVSDADIIHSRIMRTQQWRLLRYLSSVLAGAHEPGTGIAYSKYAVSWPLLNRIRWDGSAIRAFAAHAAPLLHSSQSEFMSLHMPYMLECMKRGAIAPYIEDEHAGIVEKEAKRAR